MAFDLITNQYYGLKKTIAEPRQNTGTGGGAILIVGLAALAAFLFLGKKGK